VVHALRGRVDAILCGIGTALADDPLLTARPAGPRVAVRVVLDDAARLPLASRLVQTAAEVPVLIAAGPDAPPDRVAALRAAGCEVWQSHEGDRAARLATLLAELGRRRFTNVLIEGGPGIVGGLADAALIDEVWAFIAPTLIGGNAAPGPVAGAGIAKLGDAAAIDVEAVEPLGGDLLIRGLVRRGA
jgi:diaminohydroxyphosphoribosylaminopyrimidine deaminase/5-amino-6-(5-phosphoribosylamino)uracil reductase